MSKTIKNSIIFSLYQVVMIWLLNICSFFGDQVNHFVIYLIVLITMFLSNALILNILSKNKFRSRFLFLSYIFASFFTAIVLVLFVRPNLHVVVLSFSALVVPSILPSVLVFLSDLFGLKSENTHVELAKVEFGTDQDQVLDSEKEEQNEVDFVLTNENGKVLLNVKSSKILCFEANDNYAVTYYLNESGEVKKSMERISLKKIEDILEEIGVTFFERVHKSYLININYVNDVKGKAQAYKVQLFDLPFLVPVSRSFKVDTLKK